jgi:hypothetical protein
MGFVNEVYETLLENKNVYHFALVLKYTIYFFHLRARNLMEKSDTSAAKLEWIRTKTH